MEAKKQTAYIFFAVLIALQLYSATKISSLQSQVENASNTISSLESRLNHQISSVYQNVDQKLEKQASLIHRSSIKVGQLDADTLTIPVTFTVEPKTVTETLSVSLDFNGELVRLEKSGIQYLATKDLAIADSISPQIIFEDNGIKNIEEHRGLSLPSIKEQVFLDIFARFSGKSSYGANEYHAKGNLDIDYKAARENNSLVDIKYVVKVDNEIIKETPVVLDIDSRLGGTFTLEIDDKYSLSNGQTLTSYAVATDSLGFTYEYLVTNLVAGSGKQRELYFERSSITAPNGEIVYRFDENNYEG